MAGGISDGSVVWLFQWVAIPATLKEILERKSDRHYAKATLLSAVDYGLVHERDGKYWPCGELLQAELESAKQRVDMLQQQHAIVLTLTASQ